jgi:hypothetical protein
MVKCRLCGSSALHPVLDLGTSPPSNAYLTAEQACGPETWLPLRMNVCTDCWLMQTEDFVSGADVFTSDYAYFSSMSDSWLRHAQGFVINSAERMALGADSLVFEVASNDGYLLQYVQELGIPCVGIEPTDSTADAAESIGLSVERMFLTQSSACEIIDRHGQADLVVANNVVAHVPDITDFARGLATLTKPNGTVSLEFAYGVDLVCEGQFDTVYHEHFSYLTLMSLSTVLGEAGLTLVDVEKLPTHGGSLRVFAHHHARGTAADPSVQDFLEKEVALGVGGVPFYSGLQPAADAAKYGLQRFLLDGHAARRSIAGYGAAAKGNTLLNYAGVRPDLLPYVVDRSPGKVGKFLPGSRIPVLPVEELLVHRPSAILVLPWNLGREIGDYLGHVADWAVSAWTAVPEIRQVTV